MPPTGRVESSEQAADPGKEKVGVGSYDERLTMVFSTVENNGALDFTLGQS